ncbi:2-oxoglutarate dehydrogenase, mitochondrial, partial [Cucurbita argyrosperma subsp. argyrosperma]
FKSRAQGSPGPRLVPLSRLTDSFLDITNSVYLEEGQRAWDADTTSVDESWDSFSREYAFIVDCESISGIFDQFLIRGESKWLRQTGLVVLARLERFLQKSDDNPLLTPEMDSTLRKQIQECNWQVVNASTSVNYFDVLRRQFDDVRNHSGFDKQGTRFKRLSRTKICTLIVKKVHLESLRWIAIIKAFYAFIRIGISTECLRNHTSPCGS